MMDRLAIGWEVSAVSGWGVFGLNLAKGLLARAEAPRPLLLAEPNLIGLEPEDKRALVPLLPEAMKMAAAPALDLPDAVVLDGLRSGLFGSAPAAKVGRAGARTGVVFLEDTRLGPDAIARAKGYRHLFAGSSWNAEVLRAAGIDHVSVLLQGIDPARFHPRPKAGRFGGRFVVFSGGKLEFRKGQDAVIAAFKRFHARHPDALLVCAWANVWPDSVGDIASAGLVEPPARTADGRIDIAGWLDACGLPEGSFVDLGLVPNARMPEVFAEADVALFPNRCEGGTNLVAMEAMASGVPTILSANTGHLDLIAPARCYPLAGRGPTPGPGRDGWGEPDVEEIVAALETLHADRDGARTRGAAAAAFMKGLSWDATMAALLAEIHAF